MTFSVGNDMSMSFDYGCSTNLSAMNCTEWEWLPSTETCIIMYTGFIIAVIVLVVSSILLFFTMCMRASVNLHNAMFASITRATMWFFNTNPSGKHISC